MRHPIDPRVDCVFQTLFNQPRNKALLLDFLNSLLGPALPVVDVELLNPYSPREYIGDKLQIVDVKARDTAGRTYQVEMQMCITRELAVRMLYTWSQLYKSQLTESEKLAELRPVISIWLLAQPLLPDELQWLHEFGIWDIHRAVRLSDHLQIVVIELSKWQQVAHPLASLERWLYFSEHLSYNYE